MNVTLLPSLTLAAPAVKLYVGVGATGVVLVSLIVIFPLLYAVDPPTIACIIKRSVPSVRLSAAIE